MASVKSVVFNDQQLDVICSCCCDWLVSLANSISNTASNEAEYLPFVFLDDNENLSQYQSIEAYTSSPSLHSVQSSLSISSLGQPNNLQSGKNIHSHLPALCTPAHHAKLTYLDVQSFGPPCNPLKFQPPTVYRGKRFNIRCQDPNDSNNFISAKHSITRIYTSKEPQNFGEEFTSNKAYCPIPQKERIRTSMGWIEICNVLIRYDNDYDQEQNFDNRDHDLQYDININDENKPSPPFSTIYEREFSSSDSDSETKHHHTNTQTNSKPKGPERRESTPSFFTETSKIVAVKVYPLHEIDRSQKRGSENALYEMAAMQSLGNNHPNVLGCYEVLCDGKYIYMIMPYCEGGELFQRLQNYRMLQIGNNDSKHNSGGGLPEYEARYWFRQILNAMHHLQLHGICHRDLSLENVMIDGKKCKIIDFGYCIRVPYSKRVYTLPDGRVEVRKDRRLITRRRPCGRESCMAPEFYAGESIDGFAIDLWSIGVILYELLTGQFAYDRPDQSDDIYCLLTQDLNYLLELCGVNLSKEAVHLLKGMFIENPRQRFNLADIMAHPWVTLDTG